ncbi:amidohydrolase family protein [Amycolatopsis albispora]|uniref:Amidohydrolase-related domain-containing protein n=1 Tax=Amycolatopsis albispora TaxID=1804986 RepID=A0A344LBP2_9PSEU|nr:amidohydrolase family protein [Amycolatopsis albispora]AXB45466.1 hypothetical protein A4R43_25695 [Amycolatopsis albispora]
MASSRREFLRTVSVGAASLVLPAALAGPARAGRLEWTVLAGATVIDATGAPARPDTAVVLAGDTIAWVGPRHLAPRGQVVELAGKYLVPGLWDMHSHLSERAVERIVPPSHVVNGVTGVREMWGTAETHLVRGKIERGELLGPRMVVGSGIIDGPVSRLGPPVRSVSTPDEARAVVREEQALGAEFVKTYSYLGAPEFRAVMAEARIPVTGHWPYRVPYGEVVEAGYRSFEHLFGLPIATARGRDDFQSRLDAIPFDAADPRAFFLRAQEIERLASLDHDPVRAAELFAAKKARGCWISPTLRVNQVMSSPAETFAVDERLKYIWPAAREAWKTAVTAYAPVTPEQIEQQKVFFRQRQDLVAAAYEAGVGVITGTDCGNPYCYPGSGVHDELELLAGAGLSPMSVLQVATRDATRFLGIEDQVGTVTAGKVADLLVLDANPLAAAANFRRIHAVVTRGRYLGPADRSRILAEVETAASETVLSSARRVGCGCFT